MGAKVKEVFAGCTGPAFTQFFGGNNIDLTVGDDDAIFGLSPLRRDKALLDVTQDQLGVTCEWVTIATRARTNCADDISGTTLDYVKRSEIELLRSSGILDNGRGRSSLSAGGPPRSENRTIAVTRRNAGAG